MRGKPYKALPWGQQGISSVNLTGTNLERAAIVLVGIVGEKFLIMDLGELEVGLGAISATAGGLTAKKGEGFGSMAAGIKVVGEQQENGKGLYRHSL